CGPASGAGEGGVFRWSLWAMTEAEGPLLAVLMNRRVLPKEQRDAAAAAAGEQKLSGPLGGLEGALRDRSYLLGEAFSAADLNVASVLSWLALAGVDIGKWPQAGAWLQRCTERP